MEAGRVDLFGVLRRIVRFVVVLSETEFIGDLNGLDQQNVLIGWLLIQITALARHFSIISH